MIKTVYQAHNQSQNPSLKIINLLEHDVHPKPSYGVQSPWSLWSFPAAFQFYSFYLEHCS